MDILVRFAADGLLLCLIVVAVPVILHAVRGRFWRTAPVIIMAGLTSLLAGKLMSLIYQPTIARPFLEVGGKPGAAYIDNPGFPSDHALLATVVVVAVYVLTKSRNLTIVLGIIVVVMGVARVLALVHTPVDVIGGVIAGLSGAVWYRKLTK